MHRHQADVAVRNALFWATRTVAYHHIPWMINTHPPLAQVGFTEAQCRQRYGNDVVVLLESLKGQSEEQGGIGKLICRPQGQILGAYLWGTGAGDGIGAIALAMQRRIPVQQFLQFPSPSPGFAQILSEMALTWERQHLRRDRLRYNLTELMMNWRRDWTS